MVTYLHVIFGEMVPKNAAVTLAARGIALWIVPTLVRVSHVFAPIVAFLNGMSNMLLRWMRVDIKDEVASTFTLGELQSIVAQSTAEGTVEDDAGVIGGALEFSGKHVSEIMVSRDNVHTLPFGCTPAEVEHAVARTGYSRFPVHDEAGIYMGYLHLKDALDVAPERTDQPFPWYKLRSLTVLTPTTEIDDALATMQQNRSHLAQVVDTSGTLLGVVFMEDVIEELVGEIRDTTQDSKRRKASTSHSEGVSQDEQ